MRKIFNSILIILVFSIICTSCSNKDAVTISVKVKSYENSVLYFSRLDFNQSVILDSVKISEGDNTKKFKVKQGAEPTFYTVNVKNSGAITLLAEQGEKITVTFDTKNALDYSVNGSPSSLKVQTLAVSFAESKLKIEELSKEYVKSESESRKLELQKEFDSIVKEQKEFNLKFIKDNPLSKANVMAIYQKYNDNLYLFDSSDDLITIKTVASALMALYPESDYTKGMINDVKRIEKIIANRKMQNMINNAEISIPDLEIPNKDGVKVKLSSLKGKVILLDFWVTGNTGSLLDNRELLEIYSQYKSKGFEVYQIALDESREEWQNVIENANLPWISVCEGGKGSHAALVYNVSQIPANYLIGRNQTIIGKNLYGSSLKKALANALK
ncbi:MAG: thioredoxin-like domain-containing protein [Bacteroidales bacterium]